MLSDFFCKSGGRAAAFSGPMLHSQLIQIWKQLHKLTNTWRKVPEPMYRLQQEAVLSHLTLLPSWRTFPPATLSEHWWSNTYSLCHTSGNQLGGNCSIWPLSSLRRVPSLLRPCFLHIDEPEHSFYASHNPPPRLKTKKREGCWCIPTHPKQQKTNRKGSEGEDGKLNKSRKRGRWIKMRTSLFQLRRVWDVSFHTFC